MANSLSAAKRARQNTTRRARNAAIKSKLRTITKKFLKSIDRLTADAENAPTFYKAAIREWDRAWSKGVVKRNTASRHISRLTKKFQNFQAASA